MKVNKISIENFRNYSSAEVEFDPNLNVFFGMNAQGKTNLLEAVYVSSIGKSYRASKDLELVKWNEPFFRVKTDVKRDPLDVTLEIALSRDGKKIARVDGKPVRPSGLNDSLKIVIFTPEDLNLVKGSPSYRRNFVDMEISQVNPNYKHWASVYNKAVLNRNVVLKRISEDRANFNLLDSLTEQIVDLGSRIMVKRLEFIESISQMADLSHKQISGGKDDLKVIYHPSFKFDFSCKYEEVKEEFKRNLDNIRKIEVIRGTTLFGPHRDDISFEIGGMDVQTYGSQGQQRSVVLSLKVAELDFINLMTEDSAVFLLDDVLSELDEKRRDHLMDKAIIKYQTLITTADLDCCRFLPSGCRKFEVSEGHILAK